MACSRPHFLYTSEPDGMSHYSIVALDTKTRASTIRAGRISNYLPTAVFNGLSHAPRSASVNSPIIRIGFPPLIRLRWRGAGEGFI